MNWPQIHAELSEAIQNAGRIREDLDRGELSTLRRIWRQFRYAFLSIRIRRLTEKLHRSTRT